MKWNFKDIAYKLTKKYDWLNDNFMENSRYNLPIKARGGGSAVFISSIAGYQAMQAMGPYSISKTALLALTKSLATETAADNIRVNCVAPGIVRYLSGLILRLISKVSVGVDEIFF